MEYYAKGIDIDGDEIDFPVEADGSLYCGNKNLVSLESNATYVDCWNNCLTELNLPNAEYVYCENNSLTELNLSNAKTVYCYNNCLTQLNLPEAKRVYCDNTGLTDILDLILDKSINRTELKLTIHIR
jgi:hypothetical protein